MEHCSASLCTEHATKYYDQVQHRSFTPVIYNILADYGIRNPTRFQYIRSLRMNLMTCRYIHRLTVNDRSFRSVFVRRIRGRQQGTDITTSITFSSFICKGKFSYNLEDIRSFQLSTSTKYKTRPGQVLAMVNDISANTQRIVLEIQKCTQRDRVRVDKNGSPPHTRVNTASCSSKSAKGQPSSCGAHQNIADMIATLDQGYSAPDIRRRLIDMIHKSCDVTSFYRPYANLGESARRFLLSQRLIIGSVRVPGPVKAIYDHPIVRVVAKFLHSTLVGVKEYVEKRIPSLVPKRPGLDLYFVREKATSKNATPGVHPVLDHTHEWERVASAVQLNSEDGKAADQDTALVTRNLDLSQKTNRHRPVPLPVQFRSLITERRFISDHLKTPLIKVISRIEGSPYHNRECEQGVEDLLEFIRRTRNLGLYDRIDLRLAKFLYTRLSSSPYESFREPILYRGPWDKEKSDD